MSDERQKVQAAHEAFNAEFEHFQDLDLSGAALSDAEAMLREIGDVRVRHTGKKSGLADSKKLIGKVAPEERGEFGQFVQSVEKEIVTRLDTAELRLRDFIGKAKIERERLDVTIPGRRPEPGRRRPPRCPARCRSGSGRSGAGRR